MTTTISSQHKSSSNPAVASAAQPPRRFLARTRKVTVGVLAGAGAVAVVGLGAGIVTDGLSFDQTSGGYEAPYTGWTGTPVDWTKADVTDTGFRQPGRVISFVANCTTGMVSFEAFGATYDWQQFSPRALAVHQPREACLAAGFTPQF